MLKVQYQSFRIQKHIIVVKAGQGGFMRYIIVLLGVVLMCFCTTNVFGGMYSWTDENGVKHYSNVAPPQEAEEIAEVQSDNSSVTSTPKQSRNLDNVQQGPINESEDKGMSLRIAANSGDLEEVERLLNEGADINARAMNGMTPLILASQMGHTKVVEVLLHRGADVNAKSNAGSTALMLAKERGHKKIIALLRENGA